MATGSPAGRTHLWEKQLPRNALQNYSGRQKVNAQFKTKWRNDCEEKEDSKWKNGLLRLIPTKLYSKEHLYFE